jgi:hypothetical protein
MVLVVTGVYASEKQVQLTGLLKSKERVLRLSGSMDSFINATFNNTTSLNNATSLNLEFLDSEDDLTIEVWGNDGICVFNETTDVVNGMHIIVDLSASSAWIYEVYVYNETTGTFIMGIFELP